MTLPTQDRTVHAVTRDGGEVVRYDRAGKWWLEWPEGKLIPGRQITLRDAVSFATEPGSTIYWRRPGGRAFDAAARRVPVETR